MSTATMGLPDTKKVKPNQMRLRERITALYGRIVILPDNPEEMSDGGIVIPDVAQKRSSTGIVISVGEGRILADGDRADMDVEPGDHVAYERYAGHDIEVDNVDLRVLKDTDLLLKLNPPQ